MVDIGGARMETLLALLALQPGAAVSNDALIDELWAGEPPDGARTTLRSYVSRLRATLGDAASIDRLAAGYVLGAPADAIDAVRFEALVREGRELLERRRHRRAAEVLAAALELWRGQPFAGLAEDGAFRSAAARLDELRMLALESRIEAQLELGKDAEVVDELEGLVAAHPFWERLWHHLMLALYRSGRQAEALAAYHRARAALDEHLGIEPSQELQELEAAILRQDVPAPRAGTAPANTASIPSPLTSFIGRQRELENLAGRLRTDRLITLIGVGGVGKTRLAIEVARGSGGDVVDRAVFVDLSSISDAGALGSHVAAALAVREQPGEPIERSLADHLSSGEVLLVLDNCEHLRDAVADLAGTLLATAGGLRILATSREALGVPGETLVAVEPLGVPPSDADPSELRGSDGVRLLLVRATATRAGVADDDAAIETAARIARDLDGIPLAIELAAARATALSLDEIADRIQDRFRFLVSWRRLAAARHRTLRAAMDWSYELLTAEERALLAAMSVFVGPFDLRAVAIVCLSGETETALRLVERLVDASLVVPVAEGPTTRFRLLETVRQFAADQLSAGDAATLRRQLGEHLLEVVEGSGVAVESRASVHRYDVLAAELPNIRATLAALVEADAVLGLRIASGMERFWVTNSPREGIAILSTLLSRPDIPDHLRALGLRVRGGCVQYIGEFEAGDEDYEAALAIHRALGDRAHVGHLLNRLAYSAMRDRDTKRAVQLLDEARRATGDTPFPTDPYIEASVLAEVAFAEDRPDEGFDRLREAVDLGTAAGDPWWSGNLLQQIADRGLRLGRIDVVGPAIRQGLRQADQIGDRQGVVFSLATIAEEAAAHGNVDRAGRIWGSVEAEVDRGGPVGQWERIWEATLAPLRDPDPARFDAARAGGRLLSLREAVNEALEPLE